MVTDKQTDYAECLALFRNVSYHEALQRFARFLRRDDLQDLDRLKACLNVIKCLRELADQGCPVPDWKDLHSRNLEDYLACTERVPLQDMSPAPMLECLGLALRFHLSTSPPEELKQDLTQVLVEFRNRSREKLKDSDFLDTAIAEVDRERRFFGREDHARRATRLAETILESFSGEESRQSRAWLNNVLADIAYFHPLAHENDAERYRRVLGYLDRSLAESHDDAFARTFKRFIDRLASTTLQIKRFGHDTKTRQTNIWTILDRLQGRFHDAPDVEASLAGLRREVAGIYVVGQVVSGAQVTEEDWSSMNPVRIVESLLKERNWPGDCLTETGEEAEWQFCPEFLRLTLENLFRNSAEAYGRLKKQQPRNPCSITVDHEKRCITFRDRAGGIASNLGDVFEPYVSSKGVQTNSGLGLDQARRALEIQSPHFRLELTRPQPPDGAEFQLSLATSPTRRSP